MTDNIFQMESTALAHGACKKGMIAASSVLTLCVSSPAVGHRGIKCLKWQQFRASCCRSWTTSLKTAKPSSNTEVVAAFRWQEASARDAPANGVLFSHLFRSYFVVDHRNRLAQQRRHSRCSAAPCCRLRR